ncbi:unnamed protein product [Xylocopa violacea]
MKYTPNASEVIYTVPECIIGPECNCIDDKSKLPVPKVNVTRTENQIVVDWSTTLDASDVRFYIISIGVPLFTSKKRKHEVPLYDVIKIGQVSADKRTFLWNLRSSDREYVKVEDDYKITVKAVNYHGCFGPEGSLVARSVLSDVETVDHRHVWFMLIGIITSVILLGVLSILLYRNYNNFFVANQRNPIGVCAISECKSRWTEAILQKRNILYSRNESEEGYTEETDKLKVPLASVRLIRELGSGQFGKVYLGRLNGTEDSLVAVKMSRQGDTSIGSDARQQFLKEIEMMRTAGNHPHLVNLVGYCVQPTRPICILLEYMQGGDLLTYLHRRRKQHCDETVFDHDQTSHTGVRCTSAGNMTERARYANIGDYWVGKMKGNEFLRFAREIALGMEHLETKGITHRDLAARNILLDADLTVKIADFGLSRNGVYVITRAARKAQHLPIRWMSPEALRNRIFSSKSDVWSFGVVLWEMGTLGGFPYPNVTDDRLLRYIIYENGRLERPSDVPFDIYKLMDSCWSTEPENRPNFTEILADLRALATFDDNDTLGTISNPCYAFPFERFVETGE